MNVADPEQDEIPEATNGTTPKAVRRIPKGMSEYQAAWIIDDDVDEDDEDRKEDEDDTEMAGIQEEEEEMQDIPVEDDHQMELDNRERVTFQDLDVEEDEKQWDTAACIWTDDWYASSQRLDKWRNRRREEEDDLSFPDEVDTPKEIPARIRFQRFRGMRSFRTSPWDPYENLPRDYARIFQFEDFKRTEHAVRRRAEQEMGVVQVCPQKYAPRKDFHWLNVAWYPCQHLPQRCTKGSSD